MGARIVSDGRSARIAARGRKFLTDLAGGDRPGATVSVVLDFVNPRGAGGQRVGFGGKTRAQQSRPGR